MRTDIPPWDEYFQMLAETIALRSKDPHTRVGCVIVHPETKIIKATGYNGMIPGIVETNELWSRPLKYDYVCHAEQNAVSFAARYGISLNDCTAYITHFPCLSCFKILVQAGITHIIIPSNKVGAGFVEDLEKIYMMLHELSHIKILVLNTLHGERRE